MKDGENEIIIFELHTDMPAYQKQDITINYIKNIFWLVSSEMMFCRINPI